MSEQNVSTTHPATPPQIWANLTTDLKVKVIWLLSQLAFNFVTSQPEQPQKEAGDATILSQ